ncbi:putative alpha-L-fucosidase 1 [Arachis stenosperma]|uniref:putative alpha-L-fucosidase 1 n=1 Tax=Arachis stenosperma TaxID=217475 RepID=UPI0025AD73C4|nr:putative alpha-L-fucosidase 1 [Arachis stenosperma]
MTINVTLSCQLNANPSLPSPSSPSFLYPSSISLPHLRPSPAAVAETSFEASVVIVQLCSTTVHLIHQLQPAAIIFSDARPDTRWVGMNLVLLPLLVGLFTTPLTPIGGIYNDPRYAAEGDPAGHEWIPALCDVSIRPGWFCHLSELPKFAINLLEIYYKSVGRNCHLLLNVPPNSSGLISPEDIQVLQEFTELRRSIFSNNFAINVLLQKIHIVFSLQTFLFRLL